MASKRRLRRLGCKGKVRHRSMEGARIMLRKLKGKLGIMHAYGCRFCGGYHVGH